YVRRAHDLAGDREHGGGRRGVGDHGHRFFLPAAAAFAVELYFDRTFFTGLDRILRPFLAHGATATAAHIGEDQRALSGVGEVEFARDLVALHDLAHVEMRLFEFDPRKILRIH